MSFEETTRKTYDSISEHWESKRKYSWKPVKEFLETIQNKENKVLVDLGCGTGRDLELAVKEGFKQENCTGVDYSKGQLELVKKKEFKVHQSNLTKLPFKDNSIDVLLCIASHHHLLEDEEQEKALNEMRRVLKSKGKVLLANWFPEQSFVEEQIEKGKLRFEDIKVAKVTYTDDKKVNSRYYYFFDEKELSSLCKEAGFKIIKKEYFKGNLYLSLTTYSSISTNTTT